MVEPRWCTDDQAWTQREALPGRQDRDGGRIAQGRGRFTQGSAGGNSYFRDAVGLAGSAGILKLCNPIETPSGFLEIRILPTVRG
jgi:hypothetical protein